MNPEKKYVLKGCVVDVVEQMKNTEMKSAEKNCPLCGEVLEFYSSIVRFYCSHCREYFKYNYVMDIMKVEKGE